MPRRRPDLVLAALLALAPAAASAQETIWQRAAQSADQRAARAALARGDGYARQAAELSQENVFNRAYNTRRGEITILVLRAVEWYEKAVALDPAGAAEAHYRAAEVIYSHIVGCGDNVCDHPARGPTERAIRHWQAFERLAPRDSRLTDLFFRRSMAFTKLGGDDNLRRGIADYGRMLAQQDRASEMPSWVSTITSNMAELCMGVGDLDRAITLYRQSLELHDTPLGGYGLAVALDRDGQGVKARELMKAYADVDEKPLLALLKPGVFFVPEGEINYYMALGHEALGQYLSAANYYRQFLRALPDSRWAERARANLAAVERKGPGRTPLLFPGARR